MTWPGQKQWYLDQREGGVNSGGFGSGCDRKREGIFLTPQFIASGMGIDAG